MILLFLLPFFYGLYKLKRYLYFFIHFFTYILNYQLFYTDFF